jgi:hypothetical protein
VVVDGDADRMFMIDRSDQRGASAVLIAASLLMIMGVAAIAIDYSAALSDRRQDVSAADTSALAGALELGLMGAANPLQGVVDEAKSVADANTSDPITQADWNACTDDEALAVLSTDPSLGVTDGSPCISFSADFTDIRVQLPTQLTETSFGRVLGVDEIPTAAAAEARLIRTLGSSGSFPTGALAGTDAGEEFCVKASTPAPASNCDSFSSGNFADFNPYFYTDIPGPANPTCSSGSNPNELAWVIANGIDHTLARTDSIRPAGTRLNGDDCPGTPGPSYPYQVDTGAGYSNLDITNGLISGSSSYSGGYAGRLDRGPYQDAAADIFGKTIDNRPLWDFIDDGIPAGSLYGDCVTVRAYPRHPGWTTAAEWNNAKALMASCLENESGVLFDSGLLTSARFTTIPLFHQASTIGNNSCCYDIAATLPIFIESIWTSDSLTCTGEIALVAATSSCRHDAGMQGSISGPPGSSRIESASAFVIAAHHFPEDIAQDLGGGAAFVRVELTR